MDIKIFHETFHGGEIFSSWEEARASLELTYEGLASSELANCQEIELTRLAARLTRNGFESSGREYHNTRANLFQFFEGEEEDYDWCEPQERKKISKFLRLSPNVWRKGFYVDPVGNACLVWVAKWEKI